MLRFYSLSAALLVLLPCISQHDKTQ